MGRKGLSAVVVVLGLALVGLSVAADAIGLNSGTYVFGWEQKLGVAVGVCASWLSGLHLLGRLPRVKQVRAPADEPMSVRPVSV